MLNCNILQSVQHNLNNTRLISYVVAGKEIPGRDSKMEERKGEGKETLRERKDEEKEEERKEGER